MQRTSCIFEKKELIVVCYVSYLAVFRKTPRMPDDFSYQMRCRPMIEDWEKPAQFLKIELIWRENQDLGLNKSTWIKNVIKESGI